MNIICKKNLRAFCEFLIFENLKTKMIFVYDVHVFLFGEDYLHYLMLWIIFLVQGLF